MPPMLPSTFQMSTPFSFSFLLICMCVCVCVGVPEVNMLHVAVHGVLDHTDALHSAYITPWRNSSIQSGSPLFLSFHSHSHSCLHLCVFLKTSNPMLPSTVLWTTLMHFTQPTSLRGAAAACSQDRDCPCHFILMPMHSHVPACLPACLPVCVCCAGS